MKLDKYLILFVVILLLVVDFLAFHDLFEAHSVRDWLTLLASLLVFYYFSQHLPKKAR